MRRPLRLAALTTLVTATGGLLLTVPAHAAPTDDIRINEVQSNSADDAPDFVELTNISAAPVDVSGWIVRDDADDSRVALAAGTVVEPGAFLVVETDTGPDGFGLGSDDSARLFTADGTNLVDSYAWTEHAFTEGRIPDGTGEFVDARATPGSANVAREGGSAVVINEVETNGDVRGDWVELANTDTAQTADVSGWTLIDGDPTHEPIVLEEGTTIESGGYLAVLTEPAFGLGDPDSITVRDSGGAVVDSLAWETHSPTTLARCPDMTGDFRDSSEGTFELVNACEEIEQPEISAEPWPFGNDVHEAVAPDTWGEDMSGLDIAADGTVYAVNNDNAEIFELARDGEEFAIAGSWLPRYPDGTGTPDAEGLTVAGDGTIFLSTERNNEASNVSRPSVLRVELGDDGVSTTHEWNLTEITGELGANAGLEGIEWISDAEATELGVRGADGQPYDPAAYGEHFGGVFLVAVEQTGALHLVVLEADGGAHLLQSAQASESVPVIMGMDWRAGGNELWALCDEACENRHSLFSFVDGELTWQSDHHAPTGMNTSFTNEGLAIGWCEVNPVVTPDVLWISDTAHDGVSLRIAPGDDCVPGDDEDNGGGEDSGGGDGPGGGEGPGDGGDRGDEGDSPVPTSDDELTEDTRGDVQAPAEAVPGETIAVTIPSAAGDEVHVWLHSDPALLISGTLSAEGTIAVTIPADAELGEHQLVVQAADGSLLGWAPIELVPAATDDQAPGGDGGALAVTGAGSGLWLVTGAVLAIGLGGLLLTLAVRLRRIR